MDVLKIMCVFLLVGCTRENTAFNFCDCNDTGQIYRVVKSVDNEVVEDNYYFNTNTLLAFNAAIGYPSGNIYDFDASGTVDAADYLSMIGGYGQHPPEFNLCDVTVDFVNSHGWQSSYPDAYFCIVHITATDESALNTNACPLNTFNIEVVYQDSVMKYYFE